MPRVHHQSKPAALEEMELSPSLVWKTKVTDKVSQTAVGSLFRRTASENHWYRRVAGMIRECHTQDTQKLIENTPQDAFTNYWIWIWIRQTKHERLTLVSGKHMNLIKTKWPKYFETPCRCFYRSFVFICKCRIW
jgi:hypothetical protein